jgi:hypothetical protein
MLPLDPHVTPRTDSQPVPVPLPPVSRRPRPTMAGTTFIVALAVAVSVHLVHADATITPSAAIHRVLSLVEARAGQQVRNGESWSLAVEALSATRTVLPGQGERGLSSSAACSRAA